MSIALIAGMVIVAVSCVAFVAVGGAYAWDVTAPGYGRWIRAIGAGALLGLTGLGAWERRDDPLVAFGIALVGIALAVSFVVVHRRLTRKVRDLSS